MRADDSCQYVEILDETTELTLSDLCDACNLHADWVLDLVSYGVIEPLNKNEMHWRFSGVSLIRVKKAQRLERDLGINISGIALAIDLIDEVESLRMRVQRYEAD